MEVHHHAHTSDPPDSYRDHRGRKKWTHYFWEFLMLFLAVFCGFLAENQREHYVEHQREKSFMKTMVADINLDIRVLEECIRFRQLLENRMDTLIRLLAGNRDSLNEIYYQARWTTRTNDLFYNDRTIQQLKNSGGLRLIRKANVSENIILYDTKIRQIVLFRQPLENESRLELRHVYAKIFSGAVFGQMMANDPVVSVIKPTTNPKLFSDKPELINEAIVYVQYLKSIYAITRRMNTDVIEFGKQLIELIKKEYNLN
jgi:hypothetical protein